MPTPRSKAILPINLAKGVGGYTITLCVGSERTPVDLILDSGSSTLAIGDHVYDPNTDQNIKTTTLAQDVMYGQGGWAGAVLHTDVHLGAQDNWHLKDAPIAHIENQPNHDFRFADGIWGLAYHHLNRAYDVTEELQSMGAESTHPWPYQLDNTTDALKSFRKHLRTFPEQDITPLFTAFEEAGVTPNQFTLETHRSVEYVPRSDMSLEDIAAERHNQGHFIIGDHPTADAQTLKVLHDAYYNVNLQSVRVGQGAPIAVPPLDEAHRHNFFTNAIIDSGSSFIMLQAQVYAAVMDCLQQINPDFLTTIQAFQSQYQDGKSFNTDALDLSEWPTLFFEFDGPNDQVARVKCEPNQYWQQHAKEPDNWIFMLLKQIPKWPDQSLMGLPLMNGYACQFDRSAAAEGLIHFSPISPTHRLK